ncbi:hypothetical protein ACFW04_005844 [Cataglyphis niger]
MRNAAAILIIFLIRCVYLSTINELNIVDNVGQTALNESCIFGVKSVSMVLFNSDNPKGKNIGEEESCSYIDPSKSIVFLIHGFISSANMTQNYDLASQFIKKNYTVFSLDWSDGACTKGIPLIKLLEYPFAMKNTREVGELTAKYIITLKTKCEIPLDNIMCVGHSLGAHICGFAGKKVQELVNDKISRMIGADPAGPAFEFSKCGSRLCVTDAIHVIIIHTSSGLGIDKSIGEVDLWFNGGIKQPDCGLDVSFNCSHGRSMIYLTEMLKLDNCAYPGVQIDSLPPYPDSNTTNCVAINDDIFNVKSTNKLRKGDYYVFVQKKPSYCTQKPFHCKSLIETANN